MQSKRGLKGGERKKGVGGGGRKIYTAREKDGDI